MRDYGKVAPQFWTGTTGRALRGNPDGQLLALYLMTAPASSMTGIYYLPLTTVAFETGLPIGRVRTAFKRLGHDGVVHYDEDAALVYVPNMARFQIGMELKPRDKRIAGIVRELAPFKTHRFVKEFWHRFEGAYSLGEFPWQPLRSPLEGPSEALRCQEQDQDQDQDQEQEQEQEQDPPSAPQGGAVGLSPLREERRATRRTRGYEWSDDLRDWYAAYPRKKAPEDAAKAWHELDGQRPPLAEMLATLKWQCDTDFSKRPLDRVPYPATYLRSGQFKEKPEHQQRGSPPQSFEERQQRELQERERRRLRAQLEAEQAAETRRILAGDGP